MVDLPDAEVFAVTLQGDRPQQCLGRVTVRCPYCTCLHAHRVFVNDTIVFTRTAPCSTETDIRRYRVDLNARVPKHGVPQSHPVYAAGEDRDDNAIDVPVPNWEE
jgi:hypothetical protein